MTERQVLEEIIRQEGDCEGVFCEKCPLDGRCGDLEFAKAMLDGKICEDDIPPENTIPRSVQQARIQRRINQRLIRSVRG